MPNLQSPSNRSGFRQKSWNQTRRNIEGILASLTTSDRSHIRLFVEDGEVCFLSKNTGRNEGLERVLSKKVLVKNGRQFPSQVLRAISELPARVAGEYEVNSGASG